MVRDKLRITLLEGPQLLLFLQRLLVLDSFGKCYWGFCLGKTFYRDF